MKKREWYKTEQYRTYKRQYGAKKRQGDKERKRTLEKVKALGPLRLTVRLTDYLKSPSVNTPVETYLDTFCQTLPSDNVSRVDQPDALTLTDMDSGEIQPLDHPAWEQELDDLMEDLHDLMEDPSSSDDSVCDLLKDMSSDNWNQWFDELMEDLSDLSSSSDDSLYDLLKDMSLNEWEQFMEDVLDSFDLDDFVT